MYFELFLDAIKNMHLISFDTTTKKLSLKDYHNKYVVYLDLIGFVKDF